MTVASTTSFDVGDSFAAAFPELGVEWQGSPVPAPELLALNEELAAEVGLDADELRSPEGVAVLAGNAMPPGARPIAMAYAGHQFGGYSPRLGDGRALLLGETTDSVGALHDLHLKGSGRTPFARGGDGKAAIGPMLREYLIAEAMHALGVPTARALAVVSTGEQITREGLVPGAVLTRVAASHIRVGTFEYSARLGGPDLVRRLADYSIERHHPVAAEAGEGRFLALLEAVADVQASLISRWMLVGFIHGVMNTDNFTISGETIDYGPCAFMDRYDPSTVYSSIDHMGRYSYGNQPAIAQWNLTRLAETLLPLFDAEDDDAAVDSARVVLNAFPQRFAEYWAEGMRAKLGLVEPASGDSDLFDGLLAALHVERLDFTSTFRALASSLREGASLPQALGGWAEQWRARLDQEGRDHLVVADAMDAVNPVYIPRNHIVEPVLEAASAGDLDPFEELLAVVTNPFEKRPGHERFAEPAPDGFDSGFQTFCGT